MNSLDVKPTHPAPNFAPATPDMTPPHQHPFLKRSFDDAQHGWSSPSSSPSNPQADEQFFNEDGTRKVVKRRKRTDGTRLGMEIKDVGMEEEVIPLREGFGADGTRAHLSRGMGGTTSGLPPTPQEEQEKPQGYSQINNLLHSLHHLRVPLGTSPSDATPTPAARSPHVNTQSNSPFLVDSSSKEQRAPPGEAAKVQQTYEETNRILGSLAQERHRRLVAAGKIKEEVKEVFDDDDEEKEDPNEFNGFDEEDFGYDSDMYL